MKRLFITTTNARMFLDSYSKLEQRGAAEACLMVVDGEPGSSKTTTTQWWAVQNQAVFLRAKREWTPAWMLRDLLGQMAKTPEYSFEKMFAKRCSTWAAEPRPPPATASPSRWWWTRWTTWSATSASWRPSATCRTCWKSPSCWWAWAGWRMDRGEVFDPNTGETIALGQVAHGGAA